MVSSHYYMPAKPKRFEPPPQTISSAAKQDYSQYTFFVKTIQGSAIKLLADTLKDLVHDVTLRVNRDGISCNCMEGSKTCVINMILHADRFDTYYCPVETRVSLSMDQFSTLTGMCGHSDQLSLYQEKTEPNFMVVLIETHTQDSIMDKRWYLRLKALDLYDVDMDCTEYLSIITMSSTFFHSICRSCVKLSDTLIIESLSDRLKMGVNGMWAEGSIEITQAKDCSFIAKSDKEYKASFALRFLLLFTKATGLSNTVELYLAEDYPLTLKYMIADLGELQLSQTAIITDDDNSDGEDDGDDEEMLGNSDALL